MSNSNHRGRRPRESQHYDQPLNTPEYFTKMINRCQDRFAELLQIARQGDTDLDFLYQRLNTCGALYAELAEKAVREKITWRYYRYQHEAIERYLAKIGERLEQKKYYQQIRQDTQYPGWLKILSSVSEVIDNALIVVGLRPVAGRIYDTLVRIRNWVVSTGKAHQDLLPPGTSPRGLLGPGTPNSNQPPPEERKAKRGWGPFRGKRKL